MGAKTSIEWCDSTINGSSGCDGCELYQPPVPGTTGDALREWLRKWPCYAAHVHQNRLAHSFPANYAESFAEVRMIPGRFAQAANWSDLTGMDRPEKPWLNGKPRHIFVGDMGDFLSEAVTDEFLEAEMLAAIKSSAGQRHIWILLTKRPERLAALSEKWGGLPDNVIAMTTVTNQRTADERIPHLLRVRCKTRGLSVEPMRGAIDVLYPESLFPGGPPRCCSGHGCGCMGLPIDPPLIYGINWLICGGESGARVRDFNTEDAWSLVMQCRTANVAPFVKQLGSRPVTTNANAMDWPEDTEFRDHGEGAASARVILKDRKGGDMAEWPTELRVREMPEVRHA